MPDDPAAPAVDAPDPASPETLTLDGADRADGADRRGFAHVIAVGAMVFGVLLVVTGLAAGGGGGGSSVGARALLVSGVLLSSFGALFALLAPFVYGPTRTAGQRFAQVALPVALVALVCPALAVAAASGLGDTATSSTNVAAAGTDPATGTATNPGSAATTAGAATAHAAHGGDVGVATTVPTTAPTNENAGMAPVTTAGSLGGVSGFEESIQKALQETATTVAGAPAPTVAGAAATPQQALAQQIASTADHGHGTAVAPVPLNDVDQGVVTGQLKMAQGIALSFPTVADAEKAGYVKVTPYLPLIGAHYVKWSLMDATFDVTKPEMLLYDGTNADSKVVGLSYYVFSSAEPDGFAGPNDHWHQHIGLCLKDGVVVGGEQTTAQDCAARGGQKVDAGNGWMAHAWVVPGWEDPEGVFAPNNTKLT